MPNTLTFYPSSAGLTLQSREHFCPLTPGEATNRAGKRRVLARIHAIEANLVRSKRRQLSSMEDKKQALYNSSC